MPSGASASVKWIERIFLNKCSILDKNCNKVQFNQIN